MNNDIRTLQPAALWQNFYSLTRIPRPSGLKEQIGTFLLEYGKSLGLESFRDEIGNVIVRKPATPGYEDKPGVILQAHMDMVPQKANNLEFDFEKDPIDAHIAEDGQWVTASGTTLGADNGIGVAAAMAVLADKSLKHPALEMFITCDEETGMYGAFDLKGGVLQGKTLINLDSETEGELFVGCAGGVDADITFRYDEVPTESGDAAILLHVGGLHGGHSGIDIRLQRANANKLMFRFLRKAIAEYEARLVCVDGGGLRNAIPFDCKAVICVPREG
ncbi:MAG: beta-Ala-His dipeptidase, partial [Paludibacteraceae bacterium]|nr:beta-Ala-His dipeptidase [Paludibacteraceae bacterium]